MLGETKLKSLQALIAGATREEIVWMNGYLAGLAAQQTAVSASPAVANHKITIVFGTDTGNAKRLATDFAAKAKKTGAQVKLQSLDQYRLTDLQKEEHFLIIISTHGEGEPPSAAKKFYDYIHANTLQLTQLNYAVLALGDTAYPLFCKVGEDVDVKLQAFGGARLVPLIKCDADFEADANEWFERVLQTLGRKEAMDSGFPAIVKKSSGRRKYAGTIVSNTNLNGRGSAKQTHHIEIQAADLQYEPGDSIGIVPENPAGVVRTIIDLVSADANKTITYRGEDFTLARLLLKKLNIVYLPERVVRLYGSMVGQEIPNTRIDLLNLLKIYPVRDASQFEEVVAILEPIAPRLYSIASSLASHDNEVHLTVARDCFTVNEEVGYGLCTNYLVNLPIDATLEFYVHKNSEFRLPTSDKDVIMIGPGTGIAPFRSFIEERDAAGASGRNWLFFGDQHFESDFLYQTEIQSFLETGSLARVEVAFSRDQAEKIYVQHKIGLHGAEFYEWLQSGAYLYVCGAKEPMSVDVENVIVSVISEFGQMSSDQARSYLIHLKEEGRYQKDVY